MTAVDFFDVSPSTRKSMLANRATNTKPELPTRSPNWLCAASSMAWAIATVCIDPTFPEGRTWRFPARRKAIEGRGCFWHRHPGCRYASLPKTRRAWWEAKLEGNVARDARNVAVLEQMGWRVLVLWECELANMPAVSGRVRDFLGPSAREAT